LNMLVPWHHYLWEKPSKMLLEVLIVITIKSLLEFVLVLHHSIFPS
jgi:hypothetical protein